MSTQRREIFVLSGGGSRGAAQVGMLRVLIGAGVVPDRLVAGSVGALNACYLAVDPTSARVDRLAGLWGSMTAGTLTGPRRAIVGNLARRRPYLFDNGALRSLVASQVSTPRLQDLRVPVRVATTDLATGHAVHHDTGHLADVLCASAALPGLLPPVHLELPSGRRAQVDAGIAENLPLSGAVALAEPGDRVWVLDVTKQARLRQLRSPVDVLVAALAGSITNRPAACFADAVDVVHLKLDEEFECGGVFDFRHTAELVRRGEATALAGIAGAVPALDRAA